MYISESEVTSLILMNRSFVVNSEQVQHSGVQIVNADSVFGHVDAVIVRLAVVDATLGSTPRHPHCETAWMVIASIRFFSQLSLRVDGPAELSAPDDQRVVQHAALLQVTQQCSR